jgi:hypothetical protein
MTEDDLKRMLTLARAKGFAITPHDVRRRFGDEPLTPEDILAALDDKADSMEVTAETSDEELNRFLFGDVEYKDMTNEQKRIVEACESIAGAFPQGLSRDELSAWFDARFPTKSNED